MYMVCKIFLILMCLQIKVLGCRGDRPSLSNLNTHVVQKVAAKWEELGFELLNNESAQPILNISYS